MIAITSISPTHINADIQGKAVAGWIELGMKVVSVNSKAECDLLKSKYKDVQFYSTERTLEMTYGKPYVQISAIFDICKSLEEDNFCLINSDIELKSDVATIGKIELLMANELLMCNRINHNGDYKGAKYLAGIDVFFIHKRFLRLFPQTMHAIGMTFVDYFIPYTALNSGIQTTFIEQEIAYHLNHAAQYSRDNWLKSGRFFLWESNLYQFSDTHGVGKMSEFVKNFIYNASKTKKV
jgi:hypothetical protein